MRSATLVLEWLTRNGAWGAVERAAHRIKQERRRRNTRRRTGGDTASDLAELLRTSAYESAEAVAEAYLSDLETHSHDHPDALPLALRALLAVGREADASNVARRWHPALSRTPAGAGIVDWLGVRPVPVSWLPDGRPNLVGMNRSVERGLLAADRLAAELLRRPWSLVLEPQIYLVLYNALRNDDPSLATAFLNRFMRVHDVPECTGMPTAAGGLADVSFRAPRPVRRGPLVSVLMAAYRARHTVDHALRSMCAQSYAHLEILVADDASDDGTLDAIRAWQSRDQRIRVFRSTTNQGPYNLRNHLLSRARGDLIAFHDADDFAMPHRVAHQVRAIVRSGSDACIADLLRVRPDGSVVFFADQSAVRLSLVSLMARRPALEAAGAYRSARFGADLELFERMRRRIGTAQVHRLRSPLMLGLWARTSLTRQSGSEASENGFRSVARRRYAELVHRPDRGRTAPRDEEVEAVLRETDNWIDPAPVVELDG